MKNYIKDVKKLNNLCSQFIAQVTLQGNESAYTDRKLEAIIELSTIIKEKYETDGGNV